MNVEKYFLLYDFLVLYDGEALAAIISTAPCALVPSSPPYSTRDGESSEWVDRERGGPMATGIN